MTDTEGTTERSASHLARALEAQKRAVASREDADRGAGRAALRQETGRREEAVNGLASARAEAEPGYCTKPEDSLVSQELVEQIQLVICSVVFGRARRIGNYL